MLKGAGAGKDTYAVSSRLGDFDGRSTGSVWGMMLYLVINSVKLDNNMGNEGLPEECIIILSDDRSRERARSGTWGLSGR